MSFNECKSVNFSYITFSEEGTDLTARTVLSLRRVHVLKILVVARTCDKIGQIGQSLFSRDFRSSGKGEGLFIGTVRLTEDGRGGG